MCVGVVGRVAVALALARVALLVAPGMGGAPQCQYCGMGYGISAL